MQNSEQIKKSEMESRLASCAYPLKGIIYMAITPSLRAIVYHFLLLVTGVTIVTAVVLFTFLWNWHMAHISRFFQYTLSARLVTALLLLAESAIPAALVFSQQLADVQAQLFDETLKLQNIKPAKTSEVEERELRAMAVRPPTPHTLKEPKLLRITRPLNVVYEALFVPRLGEVFAMTKVREVASRTLGSFLPFLIPLLAYRDSAWLAADLMKRYWHLKGITDAEMLKALQDKYCWEYRGFGVVAASLIYVPVLSWALTLTNSVGAALLAARLERNFKQA